MTRRWYEKPLRIAALQCNYEGDKLLDVPAKWRAMGFNVEQLLHVTGRGYWGFFRKEEHGKILREYLKRAKEQNLKIILYLNVHKFAPQDEAQKEEWGQVCSDGTFATLYETYNAICLNSSWSDYFFRTLNELADYDFDGLFLDGPIVIEGGCWCKNCRNKFRRETGCALEEAEPEALFEFYQQTKDNFLNEVYCRFKKQKPEAPLYMNLPLMHLKNQYTKLPQALTYNDIVGTEGGFMFYGPPKDAYLLKPSLAAKLLEAVAPKKQRVIFMAGDQKPWSWLMHQPAETKLCIASSVANGASIWYGLHAPTVVLNTPGGKAASEIIRFLEKHEEYYDQTRSAARVAVMYSLNTAQSYQTTSEETDFYGKSTLGEKFLGNFTNSFQGFCDLLGRSSIPHDVVTELNLSLQRLSRYDCLILPTCACLDDKTIAVIQKYVEAGGNLISTFDTSLYNQDGNPRKNFGLIGVFGVTFTGERISFKDFNYFSKSAESVLFNGLDIPRLQAPRFGLGVVTAEKTTIQAYFHKPQQGRYDHPTEQEKPAILLNKFGKGKSLYFAGTFGETALEFFPPDYRKLIVNSVTLLARNPVELEGSMGNIELVVRQQGKRLIVHLINYAGIPPRPFEKVALQTGLKLHIQNGHDYSEAKALVAGKPCVSKRTGNSLSIDVPDVAEYEVIVVE